MVGAEFVMGTCKLCLKEQELQKSHIIPNAFFKKIKRSSGGKSGHYIAIRDNCNVFAYESFEEQLLCRNCEQKFSKEFENYAITLVLRNPSNIGVRFQKTNNRIQMQGLDFEKLKLFQLSILWRASISSKAFYSNIKLHINEEERLREILYSLHLEENSEFDYGCFMTALCLDGNSETVSKTKGVIVQPFTEMNDPFNFFVFYFGGYEWRFANPVCSNVYVQDNRVISKKGSMECLIRDLHSIPVLYQVAFNGYRNQIEGRGIDKTKIETR